eukprot:g40439.t1
MALQAALAAFRVGQHDVLTKFVANYEGKSLDLSSQNLGAVGASAVAKGLQENKTVIELRMGANEIGPAGAEAIANMLKVNEALQVLSLIGNNIGPEGAKAIADMLKVNSTLTALDIGGNGIGPQGAQSIADAIKENTALESIDPRGNNIEADDIMEEVYVRYILSNRQFKCLHDGDCKLLFNQRLQLAMLEESKILDHPSYRELCARIVLGVPLAALWATIEFVWGMWLGINQKTTDWDCISMFCCCAILGGCCWTVWLPLVLLAALSPSSSPPSVALVLSFLGGAMILFVLRIASAAFSSNKFRSLLSSNSNVSKMNRGNLDNVLTLVFMVVALVQFSDFAILLDSFPDDTVSWTGIFFLRFSSKTWAMLKFWAAFCVACLWLGYSSILLWEKSSGPYTIWEKFMSKGEHDDSNAPKLRFLTHLPGGETAITLLSDSLFLIVLVALLEFFSCSPDKQAGNLLTLDLLREDGAAPVLCWTGWHLGYTCAAVAVLVPYVIYCTTLGIEFMEDITGETQLQFTELSAVLERL